MSSRRREQVDERNVRCQIANQRDEFPPAKHVAAADAQQRSRRPVQARGKKIIAEPFSFDPMERSSESRAEIVGVVKVENGDELHD
jgi:hypothetical protein